MELSHQGTNLGFTQMASVSYISEELKNKAILSLKNIIASIALCP